MNFDMACSCGASFAMEVFDEENTLGVWLLIHRFTNAHESCGYMTRYENGSPRSNSIDVEVKENNER